MTEVGADLKDSAPSAAAVFKHLGAESLAEAVTAWRDLQGITRLVGGADFDASSAKKQVKSLIASACGHQDFDALDSAVA